MKSLTYRLWDAAGRPMEPLKGEPLGPESVPCKICGCINGAPYLKDKDAIPNTDTDLMYYRAAWSDVVCVPCAWVSQGQPPDTIRLWSLAYREDGKIENPGIFGEYLAGKNTSVERLANLPGVVFTNRSQWRPVVHLLCEPPDCDWSVCVANSGQIHIVRFGHINPGTSGWTVRFERQDVRSSGPEFSRLLFRVASLKAAGFRDDDIFSAAPSPASLMRGVEAWMTHANHIDYTAHIRSPLLELALFCCTKEYTDEWITYTAQLTDQRGALSGGGWTIAGYLKELQSGQDRPEEVLGPRSEGAPDRCGQGDDLREDGERDARPAPHRGRVQSEDKQLGLFDW